jgi:polyhydroxybutyrate depolymerase
MCQRFISNILFLLFVLFSLAAGAAANGQSSTHTVESDGVERTYKIYRPPVPSSIVLPVMIVLHGGFGNAEHIEKSSGMNLVADTGPFIAVYPNGTEGFLKRMKNRRTWNAGNCCGIAVKKEINDVKFIQKMIEDIASQYTIDRTRIYVTGMSNGAMMAYRLACEIPELLAAIIPVSGTLSVNSCEKGKDVPVLHIHGELDQNVPYSGGSGRQSVSWISHRSIPDTVQLMTGPRQCASPEITYHDNRTTSSYLCTKGAPFTLVLLKSIGHSWPDGQQQKKDSNGSQYLASEQAWNFAQQFSKMSTPVPAENN